MIFKSSITTTTAAARGAARNARPHLKKPSPAMLVAVLALVAGGGGFAYAAVSPGVIDACKNNTSGVLRAAATCKETETAISWNQVGPQGPAGSRGSVGPQGAVGPKGATGAKGAPGMDAFLAVAAADRPGYSEAHGAFLGSGNLVLTRTARIVAQSSFGVLGYLPGNPGAGSTRCGMAVYDGDTRVATLGADRLANVAFGENQSLSLLGNAVVPAGTYEVRTHCWTYGNATITGSVMAFATAA